MDENQALLGNSCDDRSNQPSCRSTFSEIGFDGVQKLNSDCSEGWWTDFHSSCSSVCSESDSFSSLEWESEVDSSGELFFIVSNPLTQSEDREPISSERQVDEEKYKKGKLVSWMRRRESKRSRNVAASENGQLQTRHRILSGQRALCNNEVERTGQVVLRVDAPGSGGSLTERLLGLVVTASLQEQQVVIKSIVNGGPAEKLRVFSSGDVLRSINCQQVTPENVEKILSELAWPCEITLGVVKAEGSEEGCRRRRSRSTLVKCLVERNPELERTLKHRPVGILFIALDNVNTREKDSDIIYCYPGQCALSSCRGTFVTLHHLFSDLTLNSSNNNHQCLSSSILLQNKLTHVVYALEGSYLLLLAVPEASSGLREALRITDDLVRCLRFNYQTLYRCFTENSKAVLDHFFSLFFCRLLNIGFDTHATHKFSFEKVSHPILGAAPSQFKDIPSAADWIPLPKNIQIQVDDALNELEANDFQNVSDESVENPRRYSILGSAIYHKGYLLTSHLAKEDLLDVHSFFRQNGLIQLFRNEPVKSLVIWRKVFPYSVNRGFPLKNNSAYQYAAGRWFLMIVGQDYDALAVMLESGQCCTEAEKNSGPEVSYVEEAEDTLQHLRKLAVGNLVSQWLSEDISSNMTSPQDITTTKASRKKEHLLQLVRTLETTPRPQGINASSSNTGNSDISSIIRTRSNLTSAQAVVETSEDSLSQATSNVSELSDENAPILGRRAERGRADEHASDVSDNSDSDWDSFRESGQQGSICSGIEASSVNPSRCRGVRDVAPFKLTTGSENTLFHYIYLDGNEGILVSPELTSKAMSSKMTQVLENFRKSAEVIHTLLENNVKYKRSNQERSKCLINKSLIAVKEHGVLLEEASSDGDGTNKLTPFHYWVVGRLFFTPQAREVYVCYHDGACQNLVEVAFRLGLTAAG